MWATRVGHGFPRCLWSDVGITDFPMSLPNRFLMWESMIPRFGCVGMVMMNSLSRREAMGSDVLVGFRFISWLRALRTLAFPLICSGAAVANHSVTSQTYPYNLPGLPAITLPCGFDDKRLPIGLQIVARPFDELSVLRAASAYERAHDRKDQHPLI
jgi:hypothetical protein